MPINWLLIGIGITATVVLLFRDWRLTIPALLLNYIALALFLAEQQFIASDMDFFGGMSTLVMVKMITGLAVTSILSITALTFSREYGLENLDEFGLAELRRAARTAQRRQASQPFHLNDYIMPFWAGVLALFASTTLPYIYAIAPTPAADFAWYWLVFTGVLTIATASDLLKIGLGLLLCTSGIDILYTAVVSTVKEGGLNVIPLVLLSQFHILLSLAIAYLCGLLYGRLKTLELNELYKQ
ncbi:MAG: hypothetical protein WCK70_14935 [Chloroflexales bacterium]|jgi:hypothetical protein